VEDVVIMVPICSRKVAAVEASGVPVSATIVLFASRVGWKPSICMASAIARGSLISLGE
jgi:hypothetical protein